MTRLNHASLAVAVLLICVAASVRAAEPDPRGKPDGIESGQTVRWYVWHDMDGWHVRTTTKNKDHQFIGTVRVVGGAIEDIAAARLENTGALKDWWKLSEGNKVLNLALKTNGAMDGFDFKPGSKANDLVFTLTIDGKERPDLIYIGKKGANPSSGTFTLPAHPNK